MPDENSLIVVSNRLPVSISTVKDKIKISNSTGGLASALIGVLRKIPFTWIGWPGTSFFPHKENEIKELLKERNLVPIFINREQEEHYYHTICNSFLWPLFHYFTDRIIHSSESWAFYEEVNQIFADEVIKNAKEGASIWVHDFHLMLLPQILRDKRPDLKIGFFFHIPFPSSEIYRMLPKREVLLKGVLGSDYIGLHTSDYARHFREACLRILGLEYGQEGINYMGRNIGVNVHPIGMNTKAFEDILNKPKYFSYIKEIKQKYKSHKVLLGVERLDYTKGISIKLRAFEHYLETNPSMIGKVVLLQVIVPSRLSSPDYQKHRVDIEKMIGRLNGKYSKPGFTPVHYIYRNLPLSELIALYCLADVCIVASIRDGMNLVAQEFVYCTEKAKTEGVLVLSEFAGVAHYLPCALLVNPFDVETMAKAFQTALEMPIKEKKDKLETMSKHIGSLDSPLWAEKFLIELDKYSAKNNERVKIATLNENLRNKVIEHAKKCSKRQIILDYDGTLREITTHPQEAIPSAEILSLLLNLSKLKNTDVHIVSGRDEKTMQTWFANIPVNLSAEHGFLKKSSNEHDWTIIVDVDLSWVPFVKKILNRAVEEVPGSLLECKRCVLTWHYRMSDVDYGAWRANELYISLIQDLANLPVEIIPGKQTLEVRAQGVSKAKYLEKILSEVNDDTFILCIGDDRTDFDMYRALPKQAVSIHVGENYAKTSYLLKSPEEVRNFLDQMYQEMKDSPKQLLDQK